MYSWCSEEIYDRVETQRFEWLERKDINAVQVNQKCLAAISMMKLLRGHCRFISEQVKHFVKQSWH